jgi:ribonucleotide monophosphatase NagD (HAD superfamily)
MIGDRMDTDVVAGIEAGMDTILVVSGTTRDEAERFRPGVAHRRLHRRSARFRLAPGVR